MPRIKRYSGRNYRGVEELDFEPGFLTIAVGPNGSGKTSLAGSIGWWASGKSPLISENGYGLTDLIRTGADYASVTLTFDSHEGEVSATRQAPPHKLSLTGAQSDIGITEAQQRLNAVMGCSGNTARLSLEPGRFFSLEAKKRNPILGELLGLFLPSEKVLELLKERAAACNLPLVEEAEKLAKGKITNDFGRWENLFKAAFTTAGQEKKSGEERLKAEQERLQQLQEALKDQPPAPTPEELQKARDEARNVYLMLSKVRNWHASTQANTRLRDEAAKIVAELQEQLRDLPTVEDARAYLEEGQQRLAFRREELAVMEKSQQDRAAARARVKELKAQIKQIEDALACASCPECKSPLPEAARQALEDKKQALFLEAQPLVEAGNTPDQTEFIADHKPRIARGENEVRRREAILKAAQEGERVRGKLQQAQAQLQEREERLAAHLAEPPGQDEETLTEWHAQADRELKDLESRAGAPGDLERCQGQIKAYQDQIASAERRRTILGELKHWFGPQGIQRQHLQQQAGPVVNNVNRILERWGLEVRWDDEFNLTVRTHATGGRFVPVSNVSDAEWILVALAHQVWLANVTGIRIVVVDRIEALDEAGQAALLEAVMELQDQLDHVFLMGVALRVPAPPEAVIIDFTERKAA